MKAIAWSALLATSLAASAVFAAAPAGAPADSHGLCNDGTYSSSAEKKGACRGHKGVKEWYGEAAGESTKGSTESKTATTTSTTAPMKGATNETPAATTTTTRKTSTTSMAAPGGSAGQVWANDSTKVYHCSGDKWYGKTKHGEYMSEADAKTKGFHADHGKACT